MRHFQRNVLLTIVVLMASSLGLWAQGNLGGLTGHITDPSGAVIPDAALKLTNMDTSVEYPTVSTSEGIYLVAALPPGRYRVSVSKPGFKTFNQEPVIISTGTVTTLDVKLTVGEVTQTLTGDGSKCAAPNHLVRSGDPHVAAAHA